MRIIAGMFNQSGLNRVIDEVSGKIGNVLVRGNGMIMKAVLPKAM